LLNRSRKPQRVEPHNAGRTGAAHNASLIADRAVGLRGGPTRLHRSFFAPVKARLTQRQEGRPSASPVPRNAPATSPSSLFSRRVSSSSARGRPADADRQLLRADPNSAKGEVRLRIALRLSEPEAGYRVMGRNAASVRAGPDHLGNPPHRLHGDDSRV